MRLPGRRPFSARCAGEGLHDVEDRRRLALVAGERRALREGVGDHDEPLGRKALQVDRPARRDLVVLVGRQFDDRRLLLVPGELADDALPERADHVVLLERREADEHGDAVAEQRDEPVLAGPKGEGDRRQDVRALEARDVEAVAEQERSGGDAGAGERSARCGEADSVMMHQDSAAEA